MTLAVLLAGCASSAVTDQGPVAKDPATKGELVRWLNGTLSATLSDFAVPGHGVTLSSTCLEWEKSQIRVILNGGQARLTWTANTPANTQLVLVAGNLRGPPDSIEGTSPLVLAVFPQEVANRGFFVGVKASQPGAVYDQPFSAEWSIPYLGATEPEPVPAGC